MEKNTFSFYWSNTNVLPAMWGSFMRFVLYPEVPFNDAKKVLAFARGNYMECYVGKDDFKKNATDSVKFLDKIFAERFIKDALTQCALHRALFERYQAIDYRSLDDASLKKLWIKLYAYHAHTIAYFTGTEEDATRTLIERINQVVSSEEAATLLVSPELDKINQESIEYLEIVEKTFTPLAALQHLRKFPWLFQNVLTYEEAVSELEKRARYTTRSDIIKEKFELREKQNYILAKHQSIIPVVHILQKLALLRTEIKSCFAGSSFYSAPILAELAERSKESLFVLTNVYRYEDICTLFETKKKLSSHEVQERQKCTLLLLQAGIVSSLYGNSAEQIAREEFGELYITKIDIKEIRGSAARPGKVTDTAYILLANDAKSYGAFSIRI